MSLYFAVVIGYEYTKIYVEEEGLNLNPLNGGLWRYFALFLTIPELAISKGAISAVTGESTINGWTVGGDSLTSSFYIRYVYSYFDVYFGCAALQALCEKNWVIKCLK